MANVERAKGSMMELVMLNTGMSTKRFRNAYSAMELP